MYFHTLMSCNKLLFIVLNTFKHRIDNEDVNFLEDISVNIQNQLAENKKYDVQTYICDEVFHKFILFCQGKLKTEKLSQMDIQEFIDLNKEFQYNKLETFLNNLIEQEKEIRDNFDDYLLNKKDILLKIPYGSLFRIFHHPLFHFQHHDEAYQFIQDLVKKTENDDFFELLSFLDSDKLSLKNNDDSLINWEVHNEFRPKTNFSSDNDGINDGKK